MRAVRHIAGLLAVIVLCACSHTNEPQSDAPQTAATVHVVHAADAVAAPGNTVGFVHMAKLREADPMAQVVAADNRQLFIMGAVRDDAASVASQAQIAHTQVQLETQLRTIAQTTQRRLAAHARQLELEDRREIMALLHTADVKGRDSSAADAVLARADAKLSAMATVQSNEYLRAIASDERATLQSVASGLNIQERSALETREAIDSAELSRAASALALHNEPIRVNLRLQLANLQLPESDRKRLTLQLEALDQRQRATLATRRAAASQAFKTLAENLARHRLDVTELTAQNTAAAGNAAAELAQGAPPNVSPAAVPARIVPVPVDPVLRAKVAAVHAKYQAAYTRDERAGVLNFQAKRAAFAQQLRNLRARDAQVRLTAQRDALQLRSARDQAARLVSADIARAITVVAAREHIHTIIVDPLGTTAGVVDLTGAVAKQLASGGS